MVLIPNGLNIISFTEIGKVIIQFINRVNEFNPPHPVWLSLATADSPSPMVSVLQSVSLPGNDLIVLP